MVALHGCTQTAAAYEHGSGWSRLADEYGFVVLYPQQTRSEQCQYMIQLVRAGRYPPRRR
ncbi:PHB depolymerase family esterase [Rhizobium populisoli]|uniref:PHB depolymerase family esterase n=1 Tax=Rhizobium populisoli TaxID=2859785 RepID=UPI0035E4464E